MVVAGTLQYLERESYRNRLGYGCSSRKQPAFKAFELASLEAARHHARMENLLPKPTCSFLPYKSGARPYDLQSSRTSLAAVTDFTDGWYERVSWWSKTVIFSHHWIQIRVASADSPLRFR